MNKCFNMIAFLALLNSPASAHEYWLEPLAYTVEKTEALQADLKNGQDFVGSRFSFVETNFEQFTIASPDVSVPVTGRNGDYPALNAQPMMDGLHIASYQGKFDRITFNEVDKIKHYIEYEGFQGVMERHLERGFAPNRFQEQYARCAKALFQVGDTGPGNDRLMGLKFELVAEKNPYTLAKTDMLPVRLYWEGEPIANVQIRMFRFDGELETKTVRTDENGRAAFPLAGGGKFMLNAVHIYEGDDDPDTKLAEWVSYWATLTFGMTDTDEVLAAAANTQN
ncbi:MAG: DUF4198 domain-containing protein [Salaquimonas sp.]